MLSHPSAESALGWHWNMLVSTRGASGNVLRILILKFEFGSFQCIWFPFEVLLEKDRGLFQCGNHCGLLFPRGLQGRTCFLPDFGVSVRSEARATPCCQLCHWDKFPQLCARIGTVTLVHLRWVDEHVDFISGKGCPREEVGLVSQSTIFKSVGYDARWDVTAEYRDCEHSGRWQKVSEHAMTKTEFKTKHEMNPGCFRRHSPSFAWCTSL